MLNDIFIDNKTEWQLVVGKGKNYLKKTFGLKEQDIQDLLS